MIDKEIGALTQIMDFRDITLNILIFTHTDFHAPSLRKCILILAYNNFCSSTIQKGGGGGHYDHPIYIQGVRKFSIKCLYFGIAYQKIF